MNIVYELPTSAVYIFEYWLDEYGLYADFWIQFLHVICISLCLFINMSAACVYVYNLNGKFCLLLLCFNFTISCQLLLLSLLLSQLIYI